MGNYINIHVKSQFKKSNLEKIGLTSNLDDDLFAELGRAYEEDLNQSKHLVSRKVKYYKSISYTIVNEDDQVDVKLRVGDIVDVLEDLSTNNSQNIETVTRTSYARIRAIFVHIKGHVLTPFLF